MDSISRHEQLLRVFHLIDILFGARQPLTTAELKQRLQERGAIDEMSDKNIRRDVEFLGRFGYAVKESKKANDRGAKVQAWSIEPGRGAEELIAPAVTLPELLSLAVARDLLMPLAGTFYWRGISQLVAKVERVATPELLDYVESHKEGLVVHPRPPAAKYQSRMLNAVNTAIRNRFELSIRYMSLADERPKRLTIQPEALVVYDGSIYIAARRSQPATGGKRQAADSGIRFYKLDRVAAAKPTSRTFTPGGTPVASVLADSITLFRGPTPPRRFRIRVDADRARWATEKPFHPRQRVRKQPDGGVILEIERGWEEELVPQLLALGDSVEVLEPADVRERIAEAAMRIAARYAGRRLRAHDARGLGG